MTICEPWFIDCGAVMRMHNSDATIEPLGRTAKRKRVSNG